MRCAPIAWGVLKTIKKVAFGRLFRLVHPKRARCMDFARSSILGCQKPRKRGCNVAERYLVQVCQQQITPVIVVADSPQEAKERALRGEGNPGDSWQEEPFSVRVVCLER